jgi:hypothetical protein
MDDKAKGRMKEAAGAITGGTQRRATRGKPGKRKDRRAFVPVLTEAGSLVRGAGLFRCQL